MRSLLVRISFATLLVAVLTAAGTAAWFDHWRHSDLTFSTATYELEPGIPTQKVIDDLANLVEPSHAFCFRICFRALVELNGVGGQLRRGEYSVDAAVTPNELLNKLVLGDVVTYQVRVPEGITVQVLLEQLNMEPNLVPLPDSVDSANLAATLDLQIPFVEGYFLPDTYQTKKGDTVAQLLSRAHSEMVAALASAWASRGDVQVSTAEELLILASIIEKETGDPDDRGPISQVFHKRLSLNMRLQTDPTVIYALGDRFDGDLRRRDLSVDSPFNTYRVNGLPPTPIALPSRAAIIAAAQPADGDFLYFVARGDGTSQFSETLVEHNQAVRRFQLQAQ